ncbi:MAG TPA: histidine ammonia-lyase [Bacteroidetes bacterium]|nr:histidine ammonia-lyase [Bacteroidota bacterium]HEX04212.1 histidine ammonia-lyase [Bacteroidota bacterium]
MDAAGHMEIGRERLTLDRMKSVGSGGIVVSLSGEAIDRMLASNALVLKLIEVGDPVYGVNTGFGKFSEVQIGAEDLSLLQKNLVRSHACGVGPALDSDLVRMILLTKATGLARGFSGCRPELAQMLVAMLNSDLLPVIPAHGSVGASGDLAPLAHVAMVMMGEGEATYEGKCLPAAEALKLAGLKPLEFAPKEGLSLINGTQVSTSLSVKAWLRLSDLVEAADAACAWTLEGVAGLTSAFDERVHQIRGHAGALTSASVIRGQIENSEILSSPEAKRRVQDPYAIRCAPQVHGTVRDVMNNVKEMLETEINGVTDNPLVFVDSGEVISGGNFHAEPVAMVSDLLSIAGTELSSISERRTFLLTDSSISGLPAFLVENGGLNSGFMIHHVTQAALVSANKTLSHPASVDSIPTSAGKEDHVSMATWAGFKANEIMDRTETVISIEMMAAAQAVDLRKPLKPGRGIQKLQVQLREHVPTLEQDRYSKPDIDAAGLWLRTRKWL